MFEDFICDDVILTNNKNSPKYAGFHLLSDSKNRLIERGCFTQNESELVFQVKPQSNIGTLPLPMRTLDDIMDESEQQSDEIHLNQEVEGIGGLPVMPKIMTGVVKNKQKNKDAKRKADVQNVGKLPIPIGVLAHK